VLENVPPFGRGSCTSHAYRQTDGKVISFVECTAEH